MFVTSMVSGLIGNFTGCNIQIGATMKVKEVIKKLVEDTFENEKEYQLEIKDKEGNVYRVTGYDWCDTTLLVEKI